MQETQVRSLGQVDFLEEEMTTHSNMCAWEIPWTEKPGGLEFMGTQRVGQDRVSKQQTAARRDNLKPVVEQDRSLRLDSYSRAVPVS